MSLSVVQTKGSSTANSGSAGTVLNSAPTIGNLVLLFIEDVSSNNVPTSVTTTFGTATQLVSNTNNSSISVWKVTVTATGTSATPTMIGGGSWHCAAIEIAGNVLALATTSPTATSATSLTVSVTPAHSGDIVVVGGANNFAALTGSPGSPWTNVAINSAASMAYQGPGVSGTVSATWSEGSATNWAGASVDVQVPNPGLLAIL